jgi:hypothetical protein
MEKTMNEFKKSNLIKENKTLKEKVSLINIKKNQNDTNILSIIDERLFILMKEQMNTEEQTLFIENFKNYLEYGNDDTKFIISLDDIWKWVGFSRKDPAKYLLTKNFMENINYIYKKDLQNILDPPSKGKNEIILMNVSTFKKFCMKASTKRADDICDYYLKMENIMNQYTKEKLQEFHALLYNSRKQELIKENPLDINKFFWTDNLISNFNFMNVLYLAYLGLIDGIHIFKYGVTKQVDIREFKQHKSTYEFFQMVHIEICDNMYFVEGQFQKVLESKCLLKKIVINNKTQTELFTITKEHTLDKIIDIVKELVLNHPLKAIQEKDIELIKLKEYYENEKIKKELETQLKEQKLINEIQLEKKELEIFYLKELNKIYSTLNK